MHKNYKLYKQAITSIIHRDIKPIELQKQIKFIIHDTKFKTSNVMIRNNTDSRKTSLDQTNVV